MRRLRRTTRSDTRSDIGSDTRSDIGGATGAGSSHIDRFARRRWGARWQRWRWALLTGLLLALGAGAAWVVMGSSLLAVQQVDVTGAGSSRVARVSPVQVRRAIGLVQGTPLARLDLDEAVREVEQLSGVESATVRRDWPATVQVAVVERQPVAAIDIGGTWRAMDASGVVFGQYPQVPEGIPAVRAGGASSAQLPETLAQAGQVIDALDPAILARLSSLDVASRDDIVLVLTSGERVRWGSAEDSARKAEVLTVLLRIPAATYDVTVPELPTTSATADNAMPPATTTP